MARALIHWLEKENRKRREKKERKDRHALLVKTPCFSLCFSLSLPLSLFLSLLFLHLRCNVVKQAALERQFEKKNKRNITNNKN